MKFSKKTIAIIMGLVFWLAGGFAHPPWSAVNQVMAYDRPAPAAAPEGRPTMPTGLSEEEQAKLDQNRANFADYLSWFVIIGGLTIAVFGILHLRRLLRG